MCGIFALLNFEYQPKNDVYGSPSAVVRHSFAKGYRRGPEYSGLEQLSSHAVFGFHRLAINGLNVRSHQPITVDGITLICNGEIYNHKELYRLLGNRVPLQHTDSDCEVIIHLYKHFGIDQTMTMLDGEFSFLLYNRTNNLMYIARDPFGVRPLYTYVSNYSKIVGFASEIKMLCGLESWLGSNTTMGTIRHFVPGKLSTWHLEIHHSAVEWKMLNERYFYLPKPVSVWTFISNPVESINFPYSEMIRSYLIQAVRKRVLNSERPVACLLSGGLDSSLVAAIAADVYKIEKMNTDYHHPIETYSIGLADSEDVKNARIVAKHIGSNHTEIILTEEEFIHAIPEVIEAIESYDTTTVRASIGNYLIGKYIAKHSDCKVILNGDGSDELCGGYLYMYNCPDAIEFDHETRRLLREIHMFDVLRSDKSISSNGLEPRTPFLDRDFVDMYLSIPPEVRYHPGKGQCEKYLLRNAFSPDTWAMNIMGMPYLPDEILWRRKEAFSDGVSKTSRSLYQIIQEYIDTHIPKEIVEREYSSSEKIIPKTTEQKYYRHIFDMHYPGISQRILPHYWMPKYVEADDASARTILSKLTFISPTAIPN